MQIELHCVFFDGEVVGLRRFSQMKYDQINLTGLSLPSDCLVFEMFEVVFVHGPNFPHRKQGFNEALALGTMVANNILMSPSFW